jgi:hypothetical protein
VTVASAVKTPKHLRKGSGSLHSLMMTTPHVQRSTSRTVVSFVLGMVQRGGGVKHL